MVNFSNHKYSRRRKYERWMDIERGRHKTHRSFIISELSFWILLSAIYRIIPIYQTYEQNS